MEEKLTFKSVLSMVWRRIVLFFQWIQKTLGFKGKGKYVKFLRTIVGTCITIWLACVTLVMVYSAFEDSIDGFISRNITGKGCYDDKELSPNVYLQLNWYDDYGRIYNYVTEEVTLNRVDWVVVPDSGDTLAVYCKGGKRGYINRFTGRIAIEAQYEKAWVFSEGLAAVQKDGNIMFIDNKGKTVLTGDWTSYYNHDLVFKNGCCVIWNGQEHGFGIIDKTGAWRIEPQYDKIRNINGLWAVGIGGAYGLMDADFNTMFPLEYEDISFEDDFIMVQAFNEPQRSYSYTGELLNDCVYDSVHSIYFESGQESCYEDSEYETSRYNKPLYTLLPTFRYSVQVGDYDYRYGLIDEYGKRITEPIYTSISPIGPQLFFCEPHGILINSKGERVE